MGTVLTLIEVEVGFELQFVIRQSANFSIFSTILMNDHFTT
jgi:hypothetical protein